MNEVSHPYHIIFHVPLVSRAQLKDVVSKYWLYYQDLQRKDNEFCETYRGF